MLAECGKLLFLLCAKLYGAAAANSSNRLGCWCLIILVIIFWAYASSHYFTFSVIHFSSFQMKYC